MDTDTVVFQWSGDAFVLLVNTEGYEPSTPDPMVWSEAYGLRGTQENWGNVWFGYKEGRVFFLSNSHQHFIHLDLLPSFFECAKTPRRFVEDFPQEEVEAFGPGLKLFVADINTGSMVYVWKRSIHEKRLHVDDVAHGVHTITETGFDSNTPKDNCLRESFNAMIAGHAELPPIQKIVEDLMRKPPFFLVSLNIPGKKYRTVRTFGMDIKVNRPQARFYERHLNDKGQWVGLGATSEPCDADD